MVTLATPLVAEWEGYSLKPRWDRIGGVMDVCYGDTEAEMREHTKAECLGLLRIQLSKRGDAIAKCVPGLVERPTVWAAGTSLAYNVGVPAFCNSTAARRFNAGNWIGGCEAFKMWVKAGGKYVQGLANRRYAANDGRIPEYTICMLGLGANVSVA